MKRALVIAIAALVTVGCAQQPETSEPVVEPAPEPTVECLPVSPSAMADLQGGLDGKQPGYTLTDAAAVPSENADAWFVAGLFTGPGAEGGQAAVWYTMYDPTIDEENAFVSVDAMAESFSDYLQPKNFSAALDGADQAKSCLE